MASLAPLVLLVRQSLSKLSLPALVAVGLVPFFVIQVALLLVAVFAREALLVFGISAVATFLLVTTSVIVLHTHK